MVTPPLCNGICVLRCRAEAVISRFKQEHLPFEAWRPHIVMSARAVFGGTCALVWPLVQKGAGGVENSNRRAESACLGDRAAPMHTELQTLPRNATRCVYRSTEKWLWAAAEKHVFKNHKWAQAIPVR